MFRREPALELSGYDHQRVTFDTEGTVCSVRWISSVYFSRSR